MDCERRPQLPQICTQHDTPFRKRRFRQISLNSAANVIIQAIDEPCVLTLSLPTNGLKGKFLPRDAMLARVLAVIMCLSVCMFLCTHTQTDIQTDT